MIQLSDYSFINRVLSPFKTIFIGVFLGLSLLDLHGSFAQNALKDVSNPTKIFQEAIEQLPPELPLPTSLHESVSFWMAIYSQYNSHHVVFYDRSNPKIIFEVQDISEYTALGQNLVRAELNAELKRKKIIKEYNDAFEYLAQSVSLSAKKKAKLKSICRLESCQLKVKNLLSKYGHRQEHTSKHFWLEAKENFYWQRGLKDRLANGIKAFDQFQAPMESIFRRHKLPVELTRLPLVESSFVIGANSRCDAKGVWQFMAPSAKEFLRLDHQIDERLSPIKSAEAAAKLLKRNLKITGSVPFAIIAYNHGTSSFQKLKKAGRLYDLSSLLDSNNRHTPLGHASRNYYSEFIAIVIVEKYRKKLLDLDKVPQNYDVRIEYTKRPWNVLEFASEHGVSLHEVIHLNPDLFKTHQRTIPAGVKIIVPSVGILEHG